MGINAEYMGSKEKFVSGHSSTIKTKNLLNFRFGYCLTIF